MDPSSERVLIVEDEDGARAGLAAVVESWGYRASTARDGQEALEKLAALSPAVLVTDLRMPRLDGLGLLRRLAEDPDRPPSIVPTAHGDEAALEERSVSVKETYIRRRHGFHELPGNAKARWPKQALRRPFSGPSGSAH